MSAAQLVAPQLKKLTEPYFDFQPDVIIEATNACNRICNGCYAANVLVNKHRASSEAKFISIDSLSQSLALVGRVPTISIRGGEPSIHPQITQMLEVASRHCDLLILETHGRWIKENDDLLNQCRRLGVRIKVSFDSMHGLTAPQLYEVHSLLTSKSIHYLVAITEPTSSRFAETRLLCHWIPNEQIIFQKKALTLSELFQPRIGVIKTSGTFGSTLTTKRDFVSEEQYG